MNNKIKCVKTLRSTYLKIKVKSKHPTLELNYEQNF